MNKVNNTIYELVKGKGVSDTTKKKGAPDGLVNAGVQKQVMKNSENYLSASCDTMQDRFEEYFEILFTPTTPLSTIEIQKIFYTWALKPDKTVLLSKERQTDAQISTYGPW